MEVRDRFDLPITSASAQAVGDYVAGVDLLLSANPGAEQCLARAVANDPDFALAHIAHARLLQLQARLPEARAAAVRAEALRDRVSVREKRHIDAIALAIRGFATEALAVVNTQAAEFPRDALPLSLALGVFGLLGFSGRPDHHEAQLSLLQELAPSWGEDWWFLAHLGWAYIETGAVEVGTRLVERRWPAIPGTPMRRTSASMGFSNPATQRVGLPFSKPGCRIMTRLGSCTAISPGIWRCSSWRAAIRTAPERSISTVSGHPSPSVRRCCRLPTPRHSCGAGGSMM
jgi:hypothetical protein